MRLDVEGNLYVAAGIRARLAASTRRPTSRPGSTSFRPTGKLRSRASPIPEDVLTNLAFGGPDGRTLYITAGKTLFTARVAVAGQVAYPVWQI